MHGEATLLKRIRLLRQSLVVFREIIAAVRMETKITLIKNVDKTVRNEWNDLQLEIADLASSTEILAAEAFPGYASPGGRTEVEAACICNERSLWAEGQFSQTKAAASRSS